VREGISLSKEILRNAELFQKKRPLPESKAECIDNGYRNVDWRSADLSVNKMPRHLFTSPG